MSMKLRKKLVVEGSLAAEVEVELLDGDEGWAPYLSLEDARRLDEMRRALRSGELKRACALGKVYELTPVSAN